MSSRAIRSLTRWSRISTFEDFGIRRFFKCRLPDDHRLTWPVASTCAGSCQARKGQLLVLAFSERFLTIHLPIAHPLAQLIEKVSLFRRAFPAPPMVETTGGYGKSVQTHENAVS
jgi:hypothetical protein